MTFDRLFCRGAKLWLAYARKQVQGHADDDEQQDDDGYDNDPQCDGHDLFVKRWILAF